MINWVLYKVGKFLVLLFPRRLSYFIAKIISTFQFYLSRKDRRAVFFNMERVLDNKNKKVLTPICLEVFRNFGKYLVDFFLFSRLDKNFITKRVTINNRHFLDELLDKCSGVIVVTAHIGNWELGGAIVALLGYPFYAVALSHNHPRVNDFFNTQRSLCGVKVIPVGIAVRRCYELLKDKKIIAFLGDRDFSGSGIETFFFGKPVRVPRGPAVFSLRVKVPILVGVMIREKNDNFSLFFEEPIFPWKEDGGLKKEEELISEYLKVIERYIKSYPSQWYMFQPFFKE